MPVIVTEHLTKKFKELVAVDDVGLEVAERESFGLLGPNGAGKTSLIRILTAVSPATSGEVRVLGRDLKNCPREVKATLDAGEDDAPPPQPFDWGGRDRPEPPG